jgi:hypothetical protein
MSPILTVVGATGAKVDYSGIHVEGGKSHFGDAYYFGGYAETSFKGRNLTVA